MIENQNFLQCKQFFFVLKENKGRRDYDLRYIPVIWNPSVNPLRFYNYPNFNNILFLQSFLLIIHNKPIFKVKDI
jgi:hypothetical protein